MRQINIARPALLPLIPFYGLAVLIRNLMYDIGLFQQVKFNIPVIALGNITVGGTGKTPHVEYLVQLLKNDYRLAVLSRGYRRKTKNFVLASKKSRVRDIGDEPLQLKLKFPDVQVAVEKNRVKGIQLLTHRIRKLELIILDDAFQHRHLLPGLSILLIDYTRPLVDDLLLPAGNLREPARNAKRADLIIVTKCPQHLSPEQQNRFIKNIDPGPKQPVFFTRYAYGNPLPVFPEKHSGGEYLTYKQLRKKHTNIMLVTGIANPKPLRHFLNESFPVTEELVFPDHHAFTLNDFKLMHSTFKSIQAKEKMIVVTEKDAVRIRELNPPNKKFRKALYYIPVEIVFLAKGQKSFNKRILHFIQQASIHE